ncbi:WhiB family transcriptional regulator [Streptomyces sp. enrichment culture]|uniref:WhiB family transcriptional regulator n=1 Tax=Streptomyces sp. enrichment culture TaxID=1795815 RepID=UPI003F552121
MTDVHEHAATYDWRDEAACVGEDPEIFFPLSDSAAPGSEASLARAICRRCPVLLDCRTWAIERGEDDGIWGATTAAQRRAVRRAATDDQYTAPAARPAPGRRRDARPGDVDDSDTGDDGWRSSTIRSARSVSTTRFP